MTQHTQAATTAWAIVQEAAQHVIHDLAGPHAAKVRGLLADIQRTGSCDFVFVEEAVDAWLTAYQYELDGYVDDTDPADTGWPPHTAACGIVFMWLHVQHGIAPPQWFTAALEHRAALQQQRRAPSSHAAPLSTPLSSAIAKLQAVIPADTQALQTVNIDPECPGCGCKAGDGLTPGCDDANGCGYWRESGCE